jgi:small subunit ribosomal protein S21e
MKVVCINYLIWPCYLTSGIVHITVLGDNKNAYEQFSISRLLHVQRERNLYSELNCGFLCSSSTNRLITSKDHASVQLNVGHLDANGIYTGQFTTFALCGNVRAQVYWLHLFVLDLRVCSLRIWWFNTLKIAFLGSIYVQEISLGVWTYHFTCHFTSWFLPGLVL